MLSAIHRFHGHGSLRYVLKHGDSFRGRHVTVKVSRHPKRTHMRAAVVISKKIHKSAVRRNRVRRRVYEILRHRLGASSASHDIVVIITSPELYALEHSELDRILTEPLIRAGLCNNLD